MTAVAFCGHLRIVLAASGAANVRSAGGGVNGAAPRRTPAQRAEPRMHLLPPSRERGLTKLNVLVPLVRLGELDALLVQSREANPRATRFRPAPRPTEILLIHGPAPVCSHLAPVSPLLSAGPWGSSCRCQPSSRGSPPKPGCGSIRPRLEGRKPEAPRHRTVM